MRDKKKETVRLAEKACAPVTRKELSERLSAKLLHNFSVQPQDATNENIYNALALVLRDLMRNKPGWSLLLKLRNNSPSRCITCVWNSSWVVRSRTACIIWI